MEFQKAAVGVCATYEWLRSHPAGCLFSLGSFDVGAVYRLGRNQIGDPGAKELAAAMRVNSSVKKLFLYGNRIGDPGATELAAAMKVNSSVTELR